MGSGEANPNYPVLTVFGFPASVSGSATPLSRPPLLERLVPHSSMSWDSQEFLGPEDAVSFVVFPVPDFIFQKKLFAAKDTGDLSEP